MADTHKPDKTRNPQDTTLRNARASLNRDRSLRWRVELLEIAVAKLERIEALRARKRKDQHV